MNLPTDLLRTFVTVADLKGFTPAAESLGRSQPAISLQIKRLEEMLDISLFKRTSRKLDLTEQGRKFISYARHILDINDEAVALFQDAQVAGEVRLGIPNEFAISFLPFILGKFARSFPDVNLSVICDLSKNLLVKLNQHELDVIVAIHENQAPDSAEKTWVEDVVWIASPGAKTYKRKPLPLIVAPEGCVYRGRILRTLDKFKKPWRIVYTSPNNEGIQAAVLARVGVTALCRSTVPEGMQILEDSDALPDLRDVEIGLHYHRELISEAAFRLVEYITARPVHPGAKLAPIRLSSRN